MKLTNSNAEKYGVIVTLVGSLVGGSFWLSSVQIQGKTNKENLENLSHSFIDQKKETHKKLDLQTEKLNKNETKLAKIEAKLDIMLQILKEKRDDRARIRRPN